MCLNITRLCWSVDLSSANLSSSSLSSFSLPSLPVHRTAPLCLCIDVGVCTPWLNDERRFLLQDQSTNMINTQPTLVVMGYHCNGYGIRSLTVPPDRAKAMAVLAPRHPGHPGCFWEFVNSTWTSEVEFRCKSNLYYFAKGFDPNTHIVLTMLVDPHSADMDARRYMWTCPGKKNRKRSIPPTAIIVAFDDNRGSRTLGTKLKCWLCLLVVSLSVVRRGDFQRPCSIKI